MSIQHIINFINIHYILCIAWILLFLAVIITTFKSYVSKVKEITYFEATILMNKEDAIVIDTRSPKDFFNGHLVNSLNIKPNELQNEKLYKLNKYKIKPVILVCAHGILSRKLGEYLVKVGFKRIYILQNGIIGWDSANLPLVRNK
ncbi:rhodanese-like domain-containing protein [Candidatus Profftia sp. (ex Adelges kitamiensis)]|uniref:rhodanese-like domain-containing protein n=1 Tax=Candidatus Profftia sp. (ex Adelges kitamiensis) TaxID=2864218 RepID=UPI001CE29F7A|nr:rhodanese-like domain-containing protein [Candidatus Profftia sp. (ex Adelges kitamiensis)]